MKPAPPPGARTCWLHVLAIGALAFITLSWPAAAEAAPPATREQALQALARPEAARRIEALERLAQAGTMSDAPRVAERLRLGGEAEHQAAHAAIWAIWGRSGDAGIDQMMARALRQIQDGEFGPALALYGEVLRLRPAFAEGWNKRATLLFMLGRHEESLRDCEQVLARNPLHFGALSGMAQIHVALGDAVAALEAYQRALKINPRLPGAAHNLRQLEQAAREQRRAAGASRT